MLLFLLFDNGMLSQLLIQHPVVSVCKVAVCDIDGFGMLVYPFIFRILAYKGDQLLCFELNFPRDAMITQYGRPKIVDTLLTLIIMMG